ncbi:Rho GTPase [Vairimorpha necatrix]|uniref:Rho GTPase n=1 Tax=Vairimorpha necatrix TaxID=6039 RepID=A0AAX4JE51_9MICR
MASHEDKKSGKVVVVGDGACGKTCLLEVFRRNQFPASYVPTVVDNFAKDVLIQTSNGEQKIVNLALWDTAGQEDYDTIRPLSYRDTDLVLICYTIENKNKLSNINRKWLMEIKNYCPGAGFFLIALKTDLRTDKDPTLDKTNFVSEQDGKDLAVSIKASKFLECSALTGQNVNETFEEAAKYIFSIKEAESVDKGCGCFPCC